MKKQLFKDLEFAVETYNDFEIISEKKFQVKTNENKTCIFPMLNKQVEVKITQPGFYQINFAHSCSVNAKIHIAPNIEVTILENKTSTELMNLNNFEYIIEDNSHVELNCVDNFNEAFVNRSFVINENALVNINLITLAKSYLESKVIINLNKQNASVDFKSITHATNKAKLYFDVTVNNNAKNTSGNIWQKAVVQLAGEVYLNASGFIKKGADNAANFQESRVLLLDEAALGEASPNLLIDHYNVQAGHAASVSRVNDEELYYLQTRGLDQNAAERLMTIAFIRPLLDSIVNPDIQKQLTDLVFERLGLDDR